MSLVRWSSHWDWHPLHGVPLFPSINLNPDTLDAIRSFQNTNKHAWSCSGCIHGACRSKGHWHDMLGNWSRSCQGEEAVPNMNGGRANFHPRYWFWLVVARLALTKPGRRGTCQAAFTMQPVLRLVGHLGCVELTQPAPSLETCYFYNSESCCVAAHDEAIGAGEHSLLVKGHSSTLQE